MQVVHHQLADSHVRFEEDGGIALIDQFQGDLTCESCIDESCILHLDSETTY